MACFKKEEPKGKVGSFSRANVVSGILGTLNHVPPRNVYYAASFGRHLVAPTFQQESPPLH